MDRVRYPEIGSKERERERERERGREIGLDLKWGNSCPPTRERRWNISVVLAFYIDARGANLSLSLSLPRAAAAAVVVVVVVVYRAVDIMGQGSRR